MKSQTLTLYPSVNNLMKPVSNNVASIDKILNSSLDVICTIDKFGHFVKLNAASFKMWGYQPEELTGTQSMNLVWKQDVLFTKKVASTIRKGRDVTNFEIHFCCKDGSIIPLIWSARWDAEEQIMYCIARDARERKRYEEELIKNQKRMNKIQQMVKVGGWEFDLLQQRTHWVSEELYNILGLDSDVYPVITSKTFRSLVHPEDLDKVAAIFNYKEKLNNHIAEHRIIRFDGTEVYLRHLMELVYDNDIPIRLTGVVQDITDQKIAEQLLIASERRYKTLVHNGFDMINILDTDGNYVYVSDSAYRILGYDPKTMIGKNAFDFIHPDDVVRMAKTFARLYTQPFVEASEPYRFKNLKGEWRWLESTAANMMHDSAVNGLVINSRDITDKKLLQEKFEKQIKEWQVRINKAAIQAQEHERSQLGRELHDNVNQVLTTVKLYTELCLDGHTDHMVLLSKSTGYLTNCINEIRTISKRLSTPTLSDMSFEDSIKELVGSLNLTDQVNIQLYIDKTQKKISQDLHLGIYRIIQEHMTNVLKHAHAENVIINISFSFASVSLKIKDDGIGFNVKAQRNGIGISNMQSRAESLNGKFRIKSSPDKGCSLLLTIPF